MKLVYIANIRIPTEKAHGIQIMKMCESFARVKIAGQDIEVELLAPGRFNSIKEDPFSFYNVKRNFKIIKIPCFGLLSIGGFLGQVSFLAQTVSFLLAARIHFLFHRFDVLYTREQLTGLFFKNFILEIHSLPKSASFFHKMIWRKAKKLVVLTGHIKSLLVANGLPKDKILVAADAVDLREFDIPISANEARAKLGLPLDKKIVLYAGSLLLFDWKGVDILLRSVKFIKSECRLVLVGGQKQEIEGLKSMSNMPDSQTVLMVGQKPHRLIPYYLKAADVLVLPNKAGDIWSEYYTSPLKLFEYMAGRRPIVASDLPAIREILDRDSALLFEANNPVDLAEKINLLLDNPDLGRRFADQAFQVVSNYTWDKRAQIIINFIQNMPGSENSAV